MQTEEMKRKAKSEQEHRRFFAKEIQEDILKSPRSIGYKQSNWTGKLLMRRMREKYGVEYKQANIYVLLKSLGISYQRPTRLYGECSKEKQEDFKKNFKVK